MSPVTRVRRPPNAGAGGLEFGFDLGQALARESRELRLDETDHRGLALARQDAADELGAEEAGKSSQEDFSHGS